jgi:DUF1016 N-terminal domain
MSKTPKKAPRKAAVERAGMSHTPQAGFEQVLSLIDAAKARAVAAVYTALIELYWSIGQHISRKTAEEGWGQGTVEELAETIRRRYPTIEGFLRQQPLANDAVLRNLPGRTKARTAGARMILDPQFAHFEPP